jgi:hypothetical protein
MSIVEDVLRWRERAQSEGAFEPSTLAAAEEALSAAGLFRAEPIPDREWQLYGERMKGVSFARLAPRFKISPEAVRFAFYKVKRILDAEIEVVSAPDKTGLHVKDLPLSTRAKLALQRARVFSVGDLLHTTDADLVRMRGLGIISIQAILELRSYYSSQLVECSLDACLPGVVSSTRVDGQLL